MVSLSLILSDMNNVSIAYPLWIFRKHLSILRIPINLYCYILENIKNMNNLFFSRFCGLLLLCSIGVAAFAQKGYKRAYTLFNAEGKEIGYDELIEALAQPDVVFIGEIHNCCITHWLEYEAEARLWDNYSTDYAPFVFFAKENKIPFIATNVPRRYANVVKDNGLQYLDSLSNEAKRYLPPLPIQFTYKEEEGGAFALGTGASYQRCNNGLVYSS